MFNSKKGAAFILILTLLVTSLSGCKKNNDAKEQTQSTKRGTGRFLESEVSLPKEIKLIKALQKIADGSLEAIGQSEDKQYYILQSIDAGESWKKKKIKKLKKEFIPHAAIAPDGNAALFHYADKGNFTMTKVDTDGSTQSISLKFPGKSSLKSTTQIQQAAYSRNGKLIIRISDGSLLSVADDGTCGKPMDTKGINVNYFGMAGNILLAVCDEGIIILDTENEKQLPRESILDDIIKDDKYLASCNMDTGQPIVFCEGNTKNSLMLSSKNGIFHFTQGGSVIEQLLDASLTNLGTGNTIFYGLAALDKNNLFIAANNGSGCKLYHYSYDKQAASVPDKELTIYALDDSIFLRQAVTLFQKEYPELHVNLQIGLSGDDGVTVEDALNVLSTNILAGKGPDVLILDGMPLEGYIEKDILADISDVVKEVDKKEGLLSNIVEASKQDGKIYAIPARFSLCILEGDQKTVQSGGSLSSFAKQAASLKNTLPLKGKKGILRDLLDADSATWKNKDGSLDKERLSDYLQCCKQIYDAQSHNSKAEEHMDSAVGDGILDTGEKLGTHQYDGLLTGQWKYSFGTLSDIYGLQTLYSSSAVTKTQYCLLNHEQTKSYIPYMMAGVTESGSKEMAKNFILLLLGQKVGASEHNGIPVNRSAFEAVLNEKKDAQNVKDESSISFSMQGSDKSYGFSYINLTQKEIDAFTEIVESLKEPSLTNRVIQEIVLEQGGQYLVGKQDLEPTVSAILQKVNLYLSE